LLRIQYLNIMVVGNFSENAAEFDNFQIWDVSTFDDFLAGNAVIREIASKEFKVVSTKREELLKKPVISSIALIQDVLDLINDKHFLVFEKDDDVHTELKVMQHTKVMDFGIDISDIDESHVYIMIMDRARKKAY